MEDKIINYKHPQTYQQMQFQVTIIQPKCVYIMAIKGSMNDHVLSIAI